MLRHVALGLALVLACDPATEQPSSPAPSAPATIQDEDTAGPGGTVVAEVTPTEVDSPIQWGRYRGDRHCLELFSTGDAHLNVLGKGPKHQILGRARLTPVDDDPDGWMTLELEVTRIWSTRWTSRCRKNHELGGWKEEVTALGHRFAAGSHPLRVRALDDRAIELCAEACERLEREDSVLSGRWRHPGLETPAIPDLPVGTVLDLRIDESDAVIWLGNGPEERWATVPSAATVTPRGDDRFAVHLKLARELPSPPPGWSPDGLRLVVARQAGERLRVCRDTPGGETGCVELERQFDPYDYEVH